MSGRTVAVTEEGRGGTSNATEGGGEARPEAQMPHAGSGLNRNSCRSGISHSDERGTTQRRDPSPMEVDGSRGSPLLPGAGLGSRRAGRPTGDRGRGWRGRPTQALTGRGRRGEVGPEENEGAEGGAAPPLPEEAAPGSQNARRAEDYVARVGVRRGSTPARSQLGNRALLAGRADNSRPSRPPSLPPGAAPVSQNSGGFGSRPRSPPPFLREQHPVIDTSSSVTPRK